MCKKKILRFWEGSLKKRSGDRKKIDDFWTGTSSENVPQVRRSPYFSDTHERFLKSSSKYLLRPFKIRSRHITLLDLLKILFDSSRPIFPSKRGSCLIISVLYHMIAIAITIICHTSDEVECPT